MSQVRDAACPNDIVFYRHFQVNYLELSCTILNYLELSCTIVHIRYTCSQQMSPVIAFDIALVAQKVKVSVI